MHSEGYRQKLAGHKCSKCGRRFRESDMRISPTSFSSLAGYHLNDYRGKRLLWATCSNPDCQHKVSLGALGIMEVLCSGGNVGVGLTSPSTEDPLGHPW